jgi:triosephosphate isomerase
MSAQTSSRKTRKRRPMIAGNWKMYKMQEQTREFFKKFRPLVADSTHADIVVAPPFTAIAAAVDAARGSNIRIAAQNAYWEKEGPFTGEISMPMVSEAGCAAVIIGHSERRQFFGETDEGVNKKLKAALAANLIPIVCVGESLAQREQNETNQVLKTQLEGAFVGLHSALTEDAFSRILLAYEPVWAIGTGKTATPAIAAEVHQHLRELAEKIFSKGHAEILRILYGGSVKPGNIAGLMAQEDIDGALVGGASLDAQSFAAIVNF